MLTLGGFECEYISGDRFYWQLELAQRNAEHGTGRDDNCALDEVLELAYISRPRVAHQRVECFRGNRFNRTVHAARIFLSEVAHKCGNVVLSLAQGRHDQREHPETVIQVAAKGS